MQDCVQPLTLRAATAHDYDFLMTVFADTRSAEMALLGGDSKQLQDFISMQFNAQLENYSACYPDAENSIILLGELPIGRMLVDRSREAILLVDIAILKKYRDRGFGTTLIRELMNEATRLSKVLRLSVYTSNSAKRLYQRLGFSNVGEEASYIQMQWLPETASS